MHHKFLVFCDRGYQVEKYDEGPNGEKPFSIDHPCFVPKAVWTGSFNATHTSIRSLENAVIIHRPEAARAYYDEWKTLLGLSEPLDWTSNYVEPEYRIGS